MVVNLSEQYSLLCDWISEIRDEAVQQDRMRFRRNLERIGEFAAIEISKTLPFVEKEVQTPLGIAIVKSIKEQPVITTILRAGLPLHHGLLNYFDKADNGFISALEKAGLPVKPAYTFAEVRQLFGISQPILDAWAHHGLFRPTRMGTRFYVLYTDLITLFQAK